MEQIFCPIVDQRPVLIDGNYSHESVAAVGEDVDEGASHHSDVERPLDFRAIARNADFDPTPGNTPPVGLMAPAVVLVDNPTLRSHNRGIRTRSAICAVLEAVKRQRGDVVFVQGAQWVSLASFRDNGIESDLEEQQI